MGIVRKLGIIILLTTLNILFFACGKSEPVEDSKENQITYVSSTSVITNPERGFYHQVTVFSEAEEGVSLSYLQNMKGQNISLILGMYYLEKFKNSPLSQKELDLLRSDFSKLREAGVKCILRFAYTNTMEGEDATDAPIDIVETHIDQLAPILQGNSDVIAFMQAGFIGAWGEWHSSSNNLTSTENKKRIVNKLLDVLPLDIMLQVRTPLAKQEVFSTSNPVDISIAFSDEKRARVGHHNDCFLASTDDYGTYSNIEAEKEYIHDEALYVPTGGETCPPSGIPMADCSTARTEMEYLRWTYLHVDYYQPVINNWNDLGCYEEFKRRLGYRLELVESSFPREVKEGENLSFMLKIKNSGFAPVYKHKITQLVLKNKQTGSVLEYELQLDIREFKPSVIKEINEEINLNGTDAGTYDVYLKISDDSESLKDRPEYCIQLANQNTWVPDEGLNDLQYDLIIAN